MVIRPAATLAITRDTSKGLEVLLLQRTWDAVFMPGYWVYPGGALDSADGECGPWLDGHDDGSTSAMLDVESGGAAYLVAALRECFEESGILLATDHKGEFLNGGKGEIDREREDVCRGELTMAALCRRHNLRLPLDRLAYLSRWITPPGASRRFDTRFFVAAGPPGQAAVHDGVETIDHVWLSPGQALADHRDGTRLFGAPTLKTLRMLANFDSTDALLAHSHAQPPEPFPSEPWPAVDTNNQHQWIEPGAGAYDEIRKLDPDRTGTAVAAITPGKTVTLAPGVRRLTAPNAGMMTGSGTNTYLLGTDRFTVIDPGPANSQHLERILGLTRGRISQILVTHTHRDHSPGAIALKSQTQAPVMGMPAPEDPSQDPDFEPDKTLEHGEALTTEAGNLKVLHTPGHASNHLCYLLENEQILFSGDHIMQGSTVVINPPDGDMKAYLDSLGQLLHEDIQFIAPGHGFLMGHAHAVIDYVSTHRLVREHKVLATLRTHGAGRLPDLTPRVYDDVPPAVHGIASRSLLAHLIKLEQDGLVTLAGDVWHPAKPAEA
jgi:glyoxylase-like metal-dependent hydrolase (beta-lactamase superfamily II)/8-oxo-dGTP pyrophosphatase MutT (NUDIX family)